MYAGGIRFHTAPTTFSASILKNVAQWERYINSKGVCAPPRRGGSIHALCNSDKDNLRRGMLWTSLATWVVLVPLLVWSISGAHMEAWATPVLHDLLSSPSWLRIMEELQDESGIHLGKVPVHSTAQNFSLHHGDARAFRKHTIKYTSSQSMDTTVEIGRGGGPVKPTLGCMTPTNTGNPPSTMQARIKVGAMYGNNQWRNGPIRSAYDEVQRDYAYMYLVAAQKALLMDPSIPPTVQQQWATLGIDCNCDAEIQMDQNLFNQVCCWLRIHPQCGHSVVRYMPTTNVARYAGIRENQFGSTYEVWLAFGQHCIWVVDVPDMGIAHLYLDGLLMAQSSAKQREMPASEAAALLDFYLKKPYVISVTGVMAEAGNFRVYINDMAEADADMTDEVKTSRRRNRAAIITYEEEQGGEPSQPSTHTPENKCAGPRQSKRLRKKAEAAAADSAAPMEGVEEEQKSDTF